MEGERTALETVQTVVRSVDSLSREEVQQIVALINLAYRLHVAFFPMTAPITKISMTKLPGMR